MSLPAHVVVDIVEKLRELMVQSEGCDQCIAERRVYRLRRLLVSLFRTWNGLPPSMFLHDIQLEDDYQINGGGFGDIYQASFRGKAVALKRPKVYLNGLREEQESAFRKEAIISWFLNHPNVQSFLGIDADTSNVSPPVLGMVTPWQRNGTILNCLTWLKSIGLRVLIDVWIKGIVDGLCYLHDNDVVHGDLRGDNILIDDHYTPKLADFGLSILHSGGMTSISSLSCHVGTERFAAPELLGEEEVRPTIQSDVYAFGCTCVEIFTQKLPFPDLSYFSVVTSVQKGETPPIPRDLFRSHPEFWLFVQRCWDRNPHQRPSVRFLADSLPLRTSALSALDLEACPHAEWNFSSQTDSGSNHLLDSCILRIVDTNSIRRRSFRDEMTYLSAIGCPAEVSWYARMSWDSQAGHIDAERIRGSPWGQKVVGFFQRPAERTALEFPLLKRARDLRKLGKYKDAFEHDRQTVQVYRHLAQRDPDAFNADLAGFLHNLAAGLTRLGEYKEAAEHDREAVQLRR